MKIGFSYSRCVRDIVEGNVNINDVLIIISRTDFDPRDDEQWAGIWKGYGGGGTFGNPYNSPEWMNYSAEDEVKFRDVSVELWESGKLHQPRKFGSHPRRSPYIWVDTGPIGHEQFQQPDAVQQAWRNYVMLSALTRNKEYDHG
jgi:hypothetical protein